MNDALRPVVQSRDMAALYKILKETRDMLAVGQHVPITRD
jgi:hypothetical protein